MDCKNSSNQSVLKQYKVIMVTMEDINVNTRDEYGLKAGGILCALEKFETYFSLRFGFLLYSCAESTSKVLQAKDISIQEAVLAVSTTQAFYRHQRHVR